VTFMLRLIWTSQVIFHHKIYLLKFVMEVCTALRHVAMFKNGHAQDKGHWEWEMVIGDAPALMDPGEGCRLWADRLYLSCDPLIMYSISLFIRRNL
jgi:hypothetical protein